MRRNVCGSLLVLVALAASGCETVKGVGKDIQHASEATERAIKGSDSEPRSEPINDPVTSETNEE